MYTIHRRVGASGTGADGLLKLSAALDMIQDCSMHWMESEPAFTAYLKDNNAAMVLVSRQADFIRLPRYGENIDVTTRVFDKKSFLGCRNTVITDSESRPCVLTWSIGAFVDRTSGKMVRLPPGVLNGIVLDDKVDMVYLIKKIALPEAGWQRLDAVPVRRGDIDLNRHMNNARYVDTALELLPEDFGIRRLRIEYRTPARPGALLYPRLCGAPGGKYYVLLSDARDQPYAVMEFS